MTAMTESHSLNNKLVVHLASLLDAAGIVNVLWGNYLLCIFGVPTIVEVCHVSRSLYKTLSCII